MNPSNHIGAQATPADVRRQIRESLGLPPVPEVKPTVAVEGHVCEFPLWAFSKQRATSTGLHIPYDDGSFLTIKAPEGMPGPRFPGYLDVILFYGQRDLFLQDHTSLSVYSIFQTLGMDPHHSGNYAHFRRDMHRTFALYMVTDRFRNPETGQRSHVYYFRVMRSMKLAKSRREASFFHFEALARFLYGHVIKRLGEKSLYPRNVLGFLRDVGLGYIADLEPYRRNARLQEMVFPALDLLKGQVIRTYELDARGNIVFFPKG